ncbi:unnamed protein product [Penicillium salamii]|uniref:Uncharacterized protein n=1 Tax=Penicillium salamii TaxID=1612424 RepID=A0A9W4N8U1_9EURO|nr:unnamed protein product [Penicillium salamii]CAG7951969.1 unnamed protein product [Penicillium salamii]CAG8106012.1 unnamed protein product [Penicillium salamii]CAG8116120.1 unnamed protein product [Penicillium salamii]CAG8253484.1 unnamed protein product [Penicillium salamii]
MASQKPSELPGFSVPLNFGPNWGFPCALRCEELGMDVGRLNVHRDVVMMRIINKITEIPDWYNKVCQMRGSKNTPRNNWAHSQQISDEGALKDVLQQTASGEDLTPKMSSWIIKELQWKAQEFQKTGFTFALDPGVFKSHAIPASTAKALKELSRSLKPAGGKVCPEKKSKIFNPVDPSICPVIYGRTRILPDETIGVENCLDKGQGVIIPIPPEEQTLDPAFSKYRSELWKKSKPYSRRFQWLPCDVAVDERCHITSYINNLPPWDNRELYGIIEDVLSQTIPLWNLTLAYVQNKWARIRCDEIEFLEGDYEVVGSHEDACTVILPEPGDFTPPEVEDPVDLQKFPQGLQVIVKMTNVELTPEMPSYKGEEWCLDGQLNEHICATAMYCYDSENVTEHKIAFRQRSLPFEIQETTYPQYHYEWLEPIYGFTDPWDDTPVTQDLGEVSTQEGRLITFPNTLQHSMSPFSLVDPSKPGHRKLLVFYLVDPHVRIISSANVPPQRDTWWEEREMVLERALAKLPVELRDMVRKQADDTIGLDEAKRHRLNLLKERKVLGEKRDALFEYGCINLAF